MALHIVKLTADAIRKRNIISVHACYEITPGKVKTRIGGIDHSITLALDYLQPLVTFIKRGDCLIGAVVVDQEQFKVFVSLGQNTTDRLIQKSTTVSNR